MSTKRKSREASDARAPYGTQTSRPRWVLVLWIVLFAGWMVFIFALAMRHTLRS